MKELTVIDLRDYLTQAEAAKEAEVSYNTITTYAWGGKIKTTKILGRVMIHKDDLEEFKNRKHTEAWYKALAAKQKAELQAKGKVVVK